MAVVDPLPELASVYWRPLVTDRRLVRSGRMWTLSAVAHTVPLIIGCGGAGAGQPGDGAGRPGAVGARLGDPRAVRGPRRERGPPATGGRGTRRSSLHSGCWATWSVISARELHGRTGLVLERGGLGTWLVGEAGALLVRPGGHRVNCYCVKVADASLPGGDRIAHLLLALRADEAGFATVANLAFSGAPWRLRRRLRQPTREALEVAVEAARRG